MSDTLYFTIALGCYILSMIVIGIIYLFRASDPDRERLVAAIGIATACSFAWGLVVIVGVPWLIIIGLKHTIRNDKQ